MINLTQHLATTDQLADGVVNLSEIQRQSLIALLSFDELPEPSDTQKRAKAIAAIAKYHNATAALIGGALWLMPALIKSLTAESIEPYYAFSKRVTQEDRLSDGTIQKVTYFRHSGFILATL